MARELAVWFQRSFGNNRKFEPGPFRPPSEPKKAEAPLHAEMQRLRDDKVFDGKLDALLGELSDEVWKDAG
jgi:hypothetical protein